MDFEIGNSLRELEVEAKRLRQMAETFKEEIAVNAIKYTIKEAKKIFKDHKNGGM